MNRIPVAGPWITQKEIDFVNDAIQNGWYEGAGKYPAEFEAAFGAYVGRQFALSLPSCTAGLHLALAGLGIGPGDEVIVPEITWIATAAPIDYVGATPIFVDIDPASWCLSPQAFAQAITPQTRAVILVDLYGNMPEMEEILAIAQAHHIAVIEDAAQAIGARYHGQKAGSFGLCSVFSFHGTKTLTTGEGGMLVTDDPALYQRCQMLRDHGRDPSGKLFWNLEVGYKYRMSSMQAALGLAQLERVEELIAKKRWIFDHYHARLNDDPGLTLNQEPPNTHSTYWMVTVLLDPDLGWQKEALIQAMADRGVDTRPFFYPLSQLPAYAHRPQAQTAAAQNATAYALSPYGLNLPSALTLTEEQIDTACTVLTALLKGSP
jgi:perosamine synthetase